MPGERAHALRPSESPLVRVVATLLMGFLVVAFLKSVVQQFVGFALGGYFAHSVPTLQFNKSRMQHDMSDPANTDIAAIG
jgi:hypothetical protein